MARIESTFRNMVIALTTIALVSALLLGLTHLQTAERIAENQAARQRAAIEQVLPEFDNDPMEEAYELDRFERLRFHPATLNDDPVGLAVHSYTGRGYGGDIEVMVGFTLDGTISGVQIVQHSETPGLGDGITRERFLEQFREMDPDEVDLRASADGGDIDTITAATVSTRAVADAVQRAVEAYETFEGVE